MGKYCVIYYFGHTWLCYDHVGERNEVQRFLNCNTKQFAGPDYLSMNKVGNSTSNYTTIDDRLITSVIDQLVKAHSELDAYALAGMMRGIYSKLFQNRPANW